ISLSLKATQTDPWQEFANSHQVGELVYGRITKLVPFGSFVQVGDGIEGLVHISEMAGHHVDLPEQVVTPGEELWVKIIDIDLQRRRISLSIKQAAEGGEVSEEYREAFGEHAYDEEGNYVGPVFAEAEFTPETEAQAAWADYVAEHGTSEGAPEVTDAAAVPAEAAAVPAEAAAVPAEAAAVPPEEVGVPVDSEPAPAAVAVAEAAPVAAEPAVAAPAAEPAAPVEATEPGATE
ncbi:MAG TPA: S1 RNA-binding domain-containing protein, partial [Acidimicrobiales bacterium]|nr:S1 RNA-binding domain-containing protein [Acidimicrobiales bacterium]